MTWDGSILTDKTLLLYGEQGIGDEVMFSSCLSELIAQQPKQIILEYDLCLKPLVGRSFPSNKGSAKKHIVNHSNEKITIDFQVALGNIPIFLHPDLGSFPVPKPFLIPDPNLVDKWINRFNNIGSGMKIGISWRGGSTDLNKKTRSTPLQMWKSVLKSKAHFINLQYGDCVSEINKVKETTGITIHDWPDADPLKDLDNFAAQIAVLDLVISIDNSTVHFAGALGKPTWILLPFAPEWRWLLNRDDSLWYPTVRLFRQQKIGDWETVFKEVHKTLLDSHMMSN